MAVQAKIKENEDYRQLLKKYMSVVIGNEGYDYTARTDAEHAAVELNAHEIAALKSISEELGYD